jgi:hypothetical protein
MKRFKFAAVSAVLTALMVSSAAFAADWTEVHAGSLPATAEVTNSDGTSPLQSISGALDVTVFAEGPVAEIDLFQISITDYLSFSAQTAADFDTALFLFDSSGHGVYMNDDNGMGLLSTLPSGSSFGPSYNGLYYIGIALGGVVPTGGIFDNLGDFTAVTGATFGSGSLTGWGDPMFPLSGDTPSFLSYQVSFTGAQTAIVPVPEPSTVALFVFGLMAVGGHRVLAARRRR